MQSNKFRIWKIYTTIFPSLLKHVFSAIVSSQLPWPMCNAYSRRLKRQDQGTHICHLEGLTLTHWNIKESQNVSPVACFTFPSRRD